MALAALLARLSGSESFAELQRTLGKKRAASLIHLPHPAKAALVAALAVDQRVVWIARDPEVAERVADTLIVLVIHVVELLFAFKYVRTYKGPLGISVLLTLLFGLFHWLPLARAKSQEVTKLP